MTDRERCYPVLRKLQEDRLIAAYIASQHPISRRWGFRLTMPDESDYWMLPREALAFAEGMRRGYGKGRDDEAADEPTEGASE